MKQTVIIHSGYYERLAISAVLNQLDLKTHAFSSLVEFYNSGIGTGIDSIILEVQDTSDDFNAVMKFIRRMNFLYIPPRVIVVTKIEQNDKLAQLSDENIDMLISEQEEISVLRKMLITGASDLNYQRALSPYFQQKRATSAQSSQKFLTATEWEVLMAIKTMKTNSNVAQKLGRSCKTISTHKRNAMKKLGLKNSIELYKYLMQ